MTMAAPGWLKAANSFVEPWKRKRSIEAAVVTGSFAVGTENPKSDVDIFMVSPNGTRWEERGNRLHCGFLIEYFISPKERIYQNMADSIRDGDRVHALMFLNGRTLFDKTGVIGEIRKKARADLGRRLKPMKKREAELAMYEIWDYGEELVRAHGHSPHEFQYLCQQYLEKTIVTYAKYLRCLLPCEYKLYQFLTDPAFRERHGLREIPDRIFVRLFLECMKERSNKRAYEGIRRLQAHVLEAMGGFSADGWRLRSRINEH